MQTITLSTTINAPVSKVWKTMLEHPTYEMWTEAFHVGSTYEGSWDKGSDIRFIALNDEGQKEGMISRVKENIPHQYISVEHYGFILNGVEDTTSEQVTSWAPSYENYSFTEKNGQTEVKVDIEVTDEYKDMFDEMWPKALAKLKAVCES